MVLKNSITYLISKGVPSIVNFVAVIVFSRLVSPAIYGSYALLVAAVTLGNSIFYQWIRLSLIRFLPSSGDRDESLSNIFIAYILSSTICVVIVIFLSLFNDLYSEEFLLYGLIILLFRGWFELNLQLYTSDLSPKKYGALLAFKALSFLIIGVCLVKFSSLDNGLVLALLLSFALPSLFGKRNWRQISFKKVSKVQLKKFIIYGVPLTISSSAIFIVNYSDRFFIEYYLERSDVGIYSIVYDFVQSSILNLMMIINLAAYPLAVRYYDNFGNLRAAIFLKKALKILFLVIIPIIIVFVSYPALISQLIFGKEYYRAAETILPLISVAIFLKGIAQYYFFYSFYLSKKTSNQMKIGMAIAVINVVLNMIFIPYFGILGSVYSTLLSFGAGIVMADLTGRSYLNLSINFEIVLIYGLPAILIATVIYILKIYLLGIAGLLVCFSLSYFLYFLTIYLLKDSLLRSLVRIFSRRKAKNQ